MRTICGEGSEGECNEYDLEFSTPLRYDILNQRRATGGRRGQGAGGGSRRDRERKRRLRTERTSVTPPSKSERPSINIDADGARRTSC